MSSNGGYEARAIGWRDPDDHELVRYQPSVVHELGELRYWHARRWFVTTSSLSREWLDPDDPFPRYDRPSRSPELVGPVLYRSRPRALRVALRKIRRIRRYELGRSIGAEEVEG